MFEQDCEKVGIGNDLQCFAFNVEQDYLNVVYTMWHYLMCLCLWYSIHCCLFFIRLPIGQSLDLQMLYKCIYPLFRFSVVVVVYIVFCNCLSLKSHLNSRCLTGSTRTGRSSWPTTLTSGATTVKFCHSISNFKYCNININSIKLQWFFWGGASKLQEEHGQFTVASNVSFSLTQSLIINDNQNWYHHHHNYFTLWPKFINTGQFP